MTSEATRKTMQANRGRDTGPELVVRHLLRDLGFPGYRLQWKKAPGRPDIAYPGRKIAIFVNGCFWHHHEGCKYATMPKTNVEFWKAKFERNIERDRRTVEELEQAGWKVVVIWECELKKDRIEQTERYLYSVLSLPE
ncbi:MAG: very short patch repair endonuclease [Coriobacteriales bacterium]